MEGIFNGEQRLKEEEYVNWNHAQEWEWLFGSSVKCLRGKIKSIGLVGQGEVKMVPQKSMHSLKEAKGESHSPCGAVALTLSCLCLPVSCL